MPFRRERAVANAPGPRFLMALGAAGVLVLVIMVAVGFNAPNSLPGQGHYTLKARFTDADNLAPHAQIRMGGRLVGQVLDPRVEDGIGVVDLQLISDVKPLLSDTRVRVRPRSLIGVRYLDLEPGTKGTPLPDHATLSVANTSSPVELDHVLDTLSPGVRARTHTLLNELGAGVVSRGDDVNETLGRAPAMLRDLTTVSNALESHPGATGRFVTGAAQLAGALEPVRREMAEGLDPESRALDAFAHHAGGLRSTLDEAPPTLDRVSATLPTIDALVDHVGGLARDGLPTLRALPAALRQAAPLLRDIRPALRAAPRTLRSVRSATPPVLGALDRLLGVLPDLDRLKDVLEPTLVHLGPRICDLKSFTGHWANMDSYGDAMGNYLRFDVYGADEETLYGTPPELKRVIDRVPQLRSRQNPYPAPCTSGSEGAHNDESGRVPNDGIPTHGAVALP